MAKTELDSDRIRYLKLKANDIRREIVKMFGYAGGGHFGGSLSASEIIAALYHEILNIRPEEPSWPERDRFILSKGHAAPALYATLCDLGYFERSIVEEFEDPGNPLTMHPNMHKVPGVDASTGSMGHGLPIGVGIALGGKLDRYTYRTFVLMGDGEIQEGSVWEAAMCAAHYELDTLVAIVDRNCLSCDGRISEIQRQDSLVQRWEAFGWAAREADGHSVAELATTLREVPFEARKPSVLIAHTTKGKGISFMEDKPGYHRANISPEEMEKALSEIAAQREKIN